VGSLALAALGRAGGGGGDNVAIGSRALASSVSGASNVAIGSGAGHSNVGGVQNVFIGFRAGYGETGSHKLYIDTGPTAAPLIGGDFAARTLSFNATPGVSLAAAWQGTVGNAGSAQAVPAAPSKYLKIVDHTGTTLLIPAYAAS
jgi:hypothetical protein